MDNKEIIISEENQKLLDRQGWFYEIEEKDAPLVNIHTHGMAENLHHPDLQIVLKLDKELVEMLLGTMVDNIKGGYTYYEGRSNKVIEDLEVEFKKFIEDGRECLRLILPDQEGRFPNEEECSEPYNQQYTEFE